MTPHPDLSTLAARALSREPSEKAPPSASQDARAIALVASAIGARTIQRRARRLRWVIGGAAAAAATVLVVGLAKHGKGVAPPPAIARAPVKPPVSIESTAALVDSVVGEAYILHRGQSQSVVTGSTVSAGDQLVVQHAAGVKFVLSTGTRITAEEGADLTVVAQGSTQFFRLAAGAMRADVRKLAAGERFVVRTLDAEIEVRGTSFRVANVPSDPSCGSGTTTRLSVYEGVVAVRAASTETSVPAGQVWPAGCADGSSASTSPQLRSAHPLSKSPVTAGSVAGGGIVPSAASARSQLAEQNDLYGSALSARAKGDFAVAIAQFERLSAKYPTAPLTENALVERMKIFASTADPRAADAARDYLARYPVGFGRADAQTILARTTSDR